MRPPTSRREVAVVGGTTIEVVVDQVDDVVQISDCHSGWQRTCVAAQDRIRQQQDIVDGRARKLAGRQPHRAQATSRHTSPREVDREPQRQYLTGEYATC